MTVYLKIYSILNKHRRYIPFAIDTFIAMLSYVTPFAISGLEPVKIELIRNTILLYTAIYIGTFVILKVYSNMWRYTGIIDLYNCIKAALLANLTFYVATKIAGIHVYYYVYLFATALSALFSVTARVVFRAILLIGKERRTCCANQNEINVMIVGAGKATSMLLHEIRTNNYNNYSVKCIIDDDTTKIGRKINSVPIMGNTDSIKRMAEECNIEQIIISIPSIDKENKKRIVNICAQTQCKLKILPEIYSLVSNKGLKDLLGNLRDVRVEDLLGREPITIDCRMTKEYIQNKVVLVTGGGGSIGSELCRQIASYNPGNLIILDIYENNAYNIQQELVRTYGDKLHMEVEIASVRDKNKLDNIFANKNIDMVFHAAAHKHVPLMEKNPEEAIKNNIIGTYNTVLMADKYKVKKFMLISTDKAVNPTNIMGATKRVCEMIVQSFSKNSSTEFAAVRFGNVLGSNGSVIPLFIEQIKAGGPVTVTHKEITRYFMTIPEAVQLVLKASKIAKSGEILVLDMGEPVKIKELAYNLIRLSGLVPERDIKINYTGLRPGEKLYEELLIKQDSNQAKTEIEKIFIEKPFKVNDSELFEKILQLAIAAQEADSNSIIHILEGMVPTYKRTPIVIQEAEANCHSERSEESHVYPEKYPVHKEIKDTTRKVLSTETALTQTT